MGFRKIFLIGCGVLENCFSWRAIVRCELFAGNWKKKGKEESKFGCKILTGEINMLARQHYQTVIDLQTKRIQTTNFLACISFLYIIFSCFSLHQHYPWLNPLTWHRSLRQCLHHIWCTCWMIFDNSLCVASAGFLGMSFEMLTN